jgi:hypothetical protein
MISIYKKKILKNRRENVVKPFPRRLGSIQREISEKRAHGSQAQAPKPEPRPFEKPHRHTLDITPWLVITSKRRKEKRQRELTHPKDGYQPNPNNTSETTGSAKVSINQSITSHHAATHPNRTILFHLKNPNQPNNSN